jgi:DtxR family Mn-dependent transcriptional regulator
LSAEGNRVALVIIRRHRLWEFFLAEKLKFNWEEVHEMAEDLEHVSNKKLIDKLDAFLGYPKFDPHGDPIPDQDGKIQKEEHVLLSELKVKAQGRVTKIKSHSTKIMDLIAHQQMNIGSKITVKKVFEFDESMEIIIDGKITKNISKQLANNIFIANDK